METAKLKKFASFARKSLIEQVGTKMKTVLAEGSLARRENPKAVADLEAKIADLGKQQTIETVAYTWFNRFCALRYMDVNRYTKIGILSPTDGQFLPEILGEAKAGHIDEEIVPAATREKVLRILDGTDPSDNPQGEAYRLLLVAACNHYHSLMPFMFEKIADFTELLLPDDLLSENSILTQTRTAITDEHANPKSKIESPQSVEVIGWLYQFYIADKKDDVFAALKKGKKITPENIPAATQLFTPHWIVRYLVENSLGRLWMLNHQESKLVERMDYYIRPEEPETDFLKIASPEEIKVCDPACGSGHMLTYAFDLLYAIYEEQGYNPTEIPRLILAHNLYGIEIDARAGALAAFALTMKAREKDRRFFSRPPIQNPKSQIQNQTIQNPNVCVLENISVDPQELDDYMDKVGRDLFSGGLQGVVNQWEEADNFGSLIRPLVTDVSDVLELLRERKMDEDLFLAGVHQKVLKALRQADYLSPKYHVVVANPPYMGGRNMFDNLKTFVNDNYNDVKSDLFSAFVVRNRELTLESGYLGFMTPFTWMFISSYESMRKTMIHDSTITSLIQLEYSGFEGATVPICTFTLMNARTPNSGVFIDLSAFVGASVQAPNALVAISDPNCKWRYKCSGDELAQIPSAPIAYWVSPAMRAVFANSEPLCSRYEPRQGMATSDNNRFLRGWFEVSENKIGFGFETSDDAKASGRMWFPYNKGGDFRKWYGNNTFVINYENDGKEVLGYARELYGSPTRTIKNIAYYFRPCVTWTYISSKYFGVRYSPPGFIFDVAGSSAFAPAKKLYLLTGYMSSSVANAFLKVINPTLNFQAGNVAALPWDENRVGEVEKDVEALVSEAVALSKSDWDSHENSWDFAGNEILQYGRGARRIEVAWQATQSKSKSDFVRLKQLEEQINKLFIQAYRLAADVSSDVPDDQITLSSNPQFRYEGDKVLEELESLLLADTMREFISYAVGCMLGRYSLDKPGLILANQGETAEDYRQQIPEPTFAPDEDNVIPMLDGDWFTDDMTERFKEFLKVTFGTEHYQENLTFLENALYPENATGKKRKTIRHYFLNGFYDHHIKLYKKRPIYWLFSSPKGTFNALIYMHRYRPDTVSTVLQYLRDFRDKLAHRRDHQQMVADSGGSTSAEKAKALKEVTTLKKQLKELEEYERDTLFPLAQKKITIDLDDGVKHNYPLFGKALKKITGLDG